MAVLEGDLVVRVVGMSSFGFIATNLPILVPKIPIVNSEFRKSLSVYRSGFGVSRHPLNSSPIAISRRDGFCGKVKGETLPMAAKCILIPLKRGNRPYITIS